MVEEKQEGAYFAPPPPGKIGLRILMPERLLLTPFCLCAKKTDSFSKNPEFLQIRGELPKLDLRHLTELKDPLVEGGLVLNSWFSNFLPTKSNLFLTDCLDIFSHRNSVV